MGFDNRDYYRESTPGRGGYSQNAACRWITILTVVVFIAQNFQQLGVEDWLRLDSRELWQHAQVWRLVTYAFCHDTNNLFHLIFNLICLWFFGRAIEDRLGSREFLAFYLISAAFAGLCHMGLEAGLLKKPALVVGGSGSLMAVMAVFAVLYPRQQVMFMMLFPIEIRWLILAYVAFDTIPIWSAIQGQEEQIGRGVAHAAHLGGLLFGFLYQVFELRLSDWMQMRSVPSWWRDRQRRRSMRLYKPESEHDEDLNLDQKVDEILKKIHEHGESSLTDRERRLLNEASRRYRERTRT